ncbi:MAG: glutamate racemase [Oscillospiraceae bacterium]|nr:glutamate racemase [Oscillospiraceae bacterium]
MDPRPIGIFDSGLGGLTAAKALEALLPGEDLIYFGDSANAPYGVRDPVSLETLATANAAFLAEFDVKAVLVACGTVSSTVIGRVREKFPFPLFDVVNAPCRAAAHLSRGGRIAVAATETSIRSGAFVRALRETDPKLTVFPKACQSLVAAVEAGHFQAGDPAAAAAVAAEMGPIRDFGPDTLLLGCTHFPLLREAIAAYLGGDVALVGVGEEAAKALRDHLKAGGMLAERERGSRRWFTSGDPAEFARSAEVFLGHPVSPEQHINSV